MICFKYDGKRFEAMDVAFTKIINSKGRGLGRGGPLLNFAGGPADDGKRSLAMDVVCSCVSLEEWEGVWGRGGTLLGRTGGGRMTGSAL